MSLFVVSSHAPGALQVYTWFLATYKVSVAVGMSGYFMLVLDMFGVGLLLARYVEPGKQQAVSGCTGRHCSRQPGGLLLPEVCGVLAVQSVLLPPSSTALAREPFPPCWQTSCLLFTILWVQQLTSWLLPVVLSCRAVAAAALVRIVLWHSGAGPGRSGQ